MPSDFIPDGFLADDGLVREPDHINDKVIIGDSQSDLGSERSSTPKSESELSSTDFDDCSGSSSDSGHESELNCSVGEVILDDLAAVSLDDHNVPSSSNIDDSKMTTSVVTQSTDGGKPPPGFEVGYHYSVVPVDENPLLVSYADGSNTFNLTGRQMCIHDVTVASVIDSSHIFVTQMKNNPSRLGLKPLEDAMTNLYSGKTVEPLMRPIAKGSVLAVASDDKFYRCQVMDFDAEKDTCEIKFVDHGGYTTVAVSDLRPLSSEYIQLPFQAIEVYLAHLLPNPEDDKVLDIVSDILFRRSVSIQMMGFAVDGVPIVQAYYYYGSEGQFVQLLTQEIVDHAYRVYLDAHPNHVPFKAVGVEWSLSSESTADLTEFMSGEDQQSGVVAQPESSAVSAGSVISSSESGFHSCDSVSPANTTNIDMSNSEFPTLEQSHPRVYEVTATSAPVQPVNYTESPIAVGCISPVPSSTYQSCPASPVAAAGVGPVSYPAVPVPAAAGMYMMPNPESGLVYPILFTAVMGAEGSINYVPVIQATAAPLQVYQTPVASADAAPALDESEVVQESLTAEEKSVEDWGQEDYENYYES